MNKEKKKKHDNMDWWTK